MAFFDYNKSSGKDYSDLVGQDYCGPAGTRVGEIVRIESGEDGYGHHVDYIVVDADDGLRKINVARLKIRDI
jgi:hypothetical protein